MTNETGKTPLKEVTEDAMEYVRKWAEIRSIEVRDLHSKGVGYDYEFVYPSGRIEKIEVKGTTTLHGIPDMSVNEFDDNKKLIADFIFVVANVHIKGEEILFKIPREAIKPENLLLKQTYHLQRFQSKKNMEKYKEK